ncbi:HAMP domain-containing protein [Oscillochloris sp. ZM17-4]|uniref:sensor histidine kinase n=1 Tax=Oscillochloris sp. ZM17-4 TaxID=2866714 RepID=UPI001C72A632|nr:ATP-binding protein [Oscillochloris sp. ZM17-4]MBX0330571.1 HAMP domain-containing protein [Oscillochloris sp. ZM17-4]
MLISITVVLAISTALSMRASQAYHKEDMLERALSQLDVISYAASVYFAQGDTHQLILTGQSATEGGEPLFVAFYALDGQLLGATAAPLAPDQARAGFGDLLQRAQERHDYQERWSGDFLEIAHPIIYQGQAAGMIAMRFSTADLSAAFRRELVSSITTAVLLIIVLNLVVGLLLRQLVLMPLRRLISATTQISAGRWVDPPGQDRPDEFGALARSFGHMLRALRARESELHAQVAATHRLNAELDARVAKRTSELALAKEAAEDANRMKSQFLANMSHELRTPLNAILNFTQFLGKERYGTLSERQHALQQRVLVNSEHLLGLINDILDLSKIESGHIDLVYEDIDLMPVLRGVMATTVGLTKEKPIHIDLDVPTALPMVRGDKTRIRQVLLNLLSNAAKFTHQGAITLHVERRDDQMLCVTVRDTGIGIAPEHHRLVFEEFRQIQGDMTREYGGTGLGLSISKHLIEMHGGQIWLESAPGAGSAFSFTLPCADSAARNGKHKGCVPCSP